MNQNSLEILTSKRTGTISHPNHGVTGFHINQPIFWTFRNTENMVM